MLPLPASDEEPLWEELVLSAPLELLTDSFSDEEEEEEPDVLPEEAPEEVLEEPDEAVLLDEEEPELPEELLEEPEEAAGAPGTVISSVLLVTVLPL